MTPSDWEAWARNEEYWRSWAATRVAGFMFFGMALGAFTASLIWWALS